MAFDEKYYREIWGSVHRHDYCPALADSLIAKYGKVRILDIGTGCGYLVRCLRERGADAWGLELSDYARAHSCCGEYVRLGSVTDIPFASSRFDVVHSQGMFEYVSEPDIPRAIGECKRVGGHQEHNIDGPADPYRDGFATIREKSWWDNQFYPKILVACPNNECKEYSFGRWIESVNRLSYANKEILVIDNSETPNFADRWRSRVPIQRIPHHPLMQVRIARSMEFLRQYALENNFSWWMNIESDVIVPADTVERLIDLSRGSFDWVSHSYPARGNSGQMTSGFGCSLFSRNLLRESFAGCPEQEHSDGWWWHSVVLPKRYPTLEVWGVLTLEHLAE